MRFTYVINKMDSDSSSSYSSSSDEETYECCEWNGACSRPKNSASRLPFQPDRLEELILRISEKFDFRVVMSDERVRNACLVTTGLSIAGSILGKHFGGNVGAAVGGAVGGVCGLGIVAISMRDAWEQIKNQLWELYELVYDYLAGLGIKDYQAAAKYLISNKIRSTELATMLLNVASDILGRKILSSLTLQ